MLAPIDISVPVRRDMPTWPGSVGFSARRQSTAGDGADATVSILTMDAHCGTHVDAPSHVLPGGKTMGSVSLETLVGEVFVADLRSAERIGVEDLERAGIPARAGRLLLRTRNSELWEEPGHDFRTDYVALTPAAARWAVERRIRLIGVDYLSVQEYEDGPETHRILLEAGVVIVEGLDLRNAAPGRHVLVCLPIRIDDAEAAPARAILLPAGGAA